MDCRVDPPAGSSLTPIGPCSPQFGDAENCTFSLVAKGGLLFLLASVLLAGSPLQLERWLLAQDAPRSQDAHRLVLMDVSNPEESERHHSRAMHLIATGNEPAAELEFRKAWELSPTVDKYSHDLTSFYINSRQYEKALDIIKDHVARRGATALGWQLQGELLFAQKQYQLAHESLLRSLELSNENYRAHQLIGLIHIVGRRT
jgi:tetratricopeptide (TPR) repeat protein